jgi:hypothetical protein
MLDILGVKKHQVISIAKEASINFRTQIWQKMCHVMFDTHLRRALLLKWFYNTSTDTV